MHLFFMPYSKIFQLHDGGENYDQRPLIHHEMDMVIATARIKQNSSIQDLYGVLACKNNRKQFVRQTPKIKGDMPYQKR